MQKVQIKASVVNLQVDRAVIRRYKYFNSVVYSPNVSGPRQPKIFTVIAKAKYLKALETYDPFVKRSSNYLYLFKRISKYISNWSSFFLDNRNLLYSKRIFKSLKNLSGMKSSSVNPAMLRYLPHLRVLKLISFSHQVTPKQAGVISRNSYLRRLKSLGVDSRSFDQCMAWMFHLDQNKDFVSHLEDLYLSWGSMMRVFPGDWELWNKLKSISIFFNAYSNAMEEIPVNLSKIKSIQALGFTFASCHLYQKELKNILSVLRNLEWLAVLNLYIDFAKLNDEESKSIADLIRVPQNLTVFRLHTNDQKISNIISKGLLASLNVDKIKSLSLQFENLNEFKNEETFQIQQVFENMRYLEDLCIILYAQQSETEIDMTPFVQSFYKLSDLKILYFETDNNITNSGLHAGPPLEKLETLQIRSAQNKNRKRISVEDIYGLINPKCITDINITHVEPLGEEEIINKFALISKMTTLITLSIRLHATSGITETIVSALGGMIANLKYIKNITVRISGELDFIGNDELDKLKNILKYQLKFLNLYNIELSNMRISS